MTAADCDIQVVTAANPQVTAARLTFTKAQATAAKPTAIGGAVARRIAVAAVRREQIAPLLTAGLSIQAIADQTGISRSAISRAKRALQRSVAALGTPGHADGAHGVTGLGHDGDHHDHDQDRTASPFAIPADGAEHVHRDDAASVVSVAALIGTYSSPATFGNSRIEDAGVRHDGHDVPGFPNADPTSEPASPVMAHADVARDPVPAEQHGIPHSELEAGEGMPPIADGPPGPSPISASSAPGVVRCEVCGKEGVRGYSAGNLVPCQLGGEVFLAHHACFDRLAARKQRG